MHLVWTLPLLEDGLPSALFTLALSHLAAGRIRRKTVESTHDPHPGGAQTGPAGPLDLWLSARNNMGN